MNPRSNLRSILQIGIQPAYRRYTRGRRPVDSLHAACIRIVVVVQQTPHIWGLALQITRKSPPLGAAEIGPFCTQAFAPKRAFGVAPLCLYASVYKNAGKAVLIDCRGCLGSVFEPRRTRYLGGPATSGRPEVRSPKAAGILVQLRRRPEGQRTQAAGRPERATYYNGVGVTNSTQGSPF